MQDQTRATLARLQIERRWKACAENEALAKAKASERPARLLAEAALAACRPWESALLLALERGAYPYIERPNAREIVSREDMVAVAHLAAQDAAVARIMLWRGASTGLVAATSPSGDPRARIEIKPRPIPERLAPPEPEPSPAAKAAPADENEIVVVAKIQTGCRVRLADRTLTDKDLAAKAREWAASGVALKVVRPRGSDYRCMAKIAWQLGQQGLKLFQFVDAP
jgi:hypothetical protein